LIIFLCGSLRKISAFSAVYFFNRKGHNRKAANSLFDVLENLFITTGFKIQHKLAGTDEIFKGYIRSINVFFISPKGLSLL
jgi:hypothetical protein